jgi:hypothetical protein
MQSLCLANPMVNDSALGKIAESDSAQRPTEQLDLSVIGRNNDSTKFQEKIKQQIQAFIART